MGVGKTFRKMICFVSPAFMIIGPCGCGNRAVPLSRKLYSPACAFVIVKVACELPTLVGSYTTSNDASTPGATIICFSQ